MHSPCRVISKDFKNGILSFSGWRSAFRGGCEEQAGKFPCFVLGARHLTRRLRLYVEDRWPDLERDGLDRASQPKIRYMMNTTKTNWPSASPQRQSPRDQKETKNGKLGTGFVSRLLVFISISISVSVSIKPGTHGE